MDIVSLYLSLLARLIQVTPPQISNQGHSMSPFYQEERQVYDYHEATLTEELSHCLQSYGLVPYTKNKAPGPHPGMLTVLKVVEPTNVLTPTSSSESHYSLSAQSITWTSL